MVYYSSPTCGKVDSSWVYTGCTIDYASSDIKYVVDAWKEDQALLASEARLITVNELASFGYEREEGHSYYLSDSSVPSWIKALTYLYWTMSPFDTSSTEVWFVDTNGSLDKVSEYAFSLKVRPVIVISKSLLQ